MLSAAVSICRCFFRAGNGSDVLQDLQSWCHDLMAATHAAKAKIYACAKHKPLITATRVAFFHYENIVQLYIHILHLVMAF